MSVKRTELEIIDLDRYVLFARPCVDINEDAVRELADRSDKEGLDFIGIVHGHVDTLDHVEYDVQTDLSENPIMSIMIRNICAGVYSKTFLENNHIELRMNKDTIFPDLDILWQTFVFSHKALFLNSDVCDNVGLDTVWMDETGPAFDVNRRFDYIRDILMKDWNLWNKWKYYFSLQRFRCYFEMIHWMTEDVGWIFAERMAVDFHRSIELEEVDETLFYPEERTALHVLAEDAGFAKRFYLGKIIYSKQVFDIRGELDRSSRRVQELENEIREKNEDIRIQGLHLEEQRRESEQNMELLRQSYDKELQDQKEMYEHSTTFRVGKAVMVIPITAKRFVKRIMRRLKKS